MTEHLQRRKKKVKIETLNATFRLLVILANLLNALHARIRSITFVNENAFFFFSFCLPTRRAKSRKKPAYDSQNTERRYSVVVKSVRR